ncbi:MAG TPA: hypothetical protein VH008_33765 [Pseudonocardia sp.]|jgi:hypothetical protein|nr:hypothetical protein [Pseudonocardia sp.]
MSKFTIGIAAVGVLLGLLFNSGTETMPQPDSLTSANTSVASAPVR